MTEQHKTIQGGLLVAIEGIDGAGKTTQARALRDLFANHGFIVHQTHEPTGGKWGTQLRQSAKEGRLDPEQELELFMRDRREHVDQLINPALARGEVVVVDRYYFSTAAYQGARGFDADELIERNEQFAPRPHLLVVLDIDPRQGLARVAVRGDVANEFEKEDLLRASGEIFGRMDGDHILHVDARRSINEVTQAILQRLDRDLFERMCLKSYKASNPDESCEPVYCGYKSQCSYHGGNFLTWMSE